MPDFLMDIAWRDFVTWASRDPDILTDFKESTGRHFGQDVAGFILWVTEHYWGVDEAPEKVREAIAAKALEEAKEVRPS